MTPTVRVALVGYGLAGETIHAPLIAATAGLSLTAVVTRSGERRARLGRDYPDARVLGSVDELLADASFFDLVVIASPNATHEALALRALDAGRHVVVDKPFATTAGGAQRIVDCALRRGRLTVPFQNRRWDGDFLTVARLVAAGTLGDVFRFESRMERWRTTAKPRWTTADALRDGEGIIYDLGSHLVDQALVLFGPAAAVYAEADARNRAVTSDDDSFIAITHRSGVRSRITLSTVAAIAGPRMSVYGTSGAFVKSGVDPQEADLKAGRRPGDPGWGEEPSANWGTLTDGASSLAVPTERGSYERFYEAIERAISTGAPPPVDPRDAVESLTVIGAALQSAATRRVVEITSTTFGRDG